MRESASQQTNENIWPNNLATGINVSFHILLTKIYKMKD